MTDWASWALKMLGLTPSWAPFEWEQFRRDCERRRIRPFTDEFLVTNTLDLTWTSETERAEFEAEIADRVDRNGASWYGALPSEPGSWKVNSRVIYSASV